MRILIAFSIVFLFAGHAYSQDWTDVSFDPLPQFDFKIKGEGGVYIDSAHPIHEIEQISDEFMEAHPDIAIGFSSQVFASLGNKKKSNASPKKRVINLGRWEIKGVVNTPNADELVYNVDELVFEPGGRLNIRANLKATLNVKDIFIQDSSAPGKIVVYGIKKPVDGRPGKKGKDGAKGQNGKSGTSGTNGGKGHRAPDFTINGLRCDHAFPLEVIVVAGRGGKGGTGGWGGRGGNGKDGRSGWSTVVDCKRGCTNGERGKPGGGGGLGGDGGDGGDGSKLQFVGPQEFLDKVRSFRVSVAGGEGGTEGSSGAGGLGGDGGKGGKNPGWCFGRCSQGRSGGITVTQGGGGDRGKHGRSGSVRHIKK